jgi:heat-inducible transcriptional repressor
MQLTERQEQILKLIVDHYINTARPVGSSTVVEQSRLGVSSATVRNEMAVLEELGLIHQLHTSGGRVPTNGGYQYYVERLMSPPFLPNVEANTIRHQFHQAHTEVYEWLKLAVNVLAARIHNVGLITAPRATEARLRHLEAISIQGAVTLLIVVLQDGTVVQEMVTTSETHSQEELSAMADRLNRDLRGLDAAPVEAKLRSRSGVEAELGMMAAHLLRRQEEQHTQVFHAGLADMIQQPEFVARRPGEPEELRQLRLRQMVDFLNQGYAVERLVAGLPPAFDVQIVIGGAGDSALQDYSFVLGRYGSATESSGFLGIVGPTRMEYPRAVALVRYMRDLMTDLIQGH